MAKPETTFIGGVHKHLPTSLYRIKNNNMYNAGQADCWYSGNKADLWVEYKFITVPKRDDTVIDLVSGKDPGISALQQEWLMSRHAEGRRVAVIVGCKEGGVWLPGTTWNKTFTASEFRALVEIRSAVAARIASVVQHLKS
jgi:hypothetical protein